MAKTNPIVKEIIQIVIFLAVAGSLIYFFWIYPLNRASDLAERPEAEQVELDSLPANDLTPIIEAGLTNVDSFRVQTDGLTSIAGAYLRPQVDPNKNPAGTVLLLHDIGEDRNDMIPLAQQLIYGGFTVILIDQRASGLSSGKFHGDGQLEATDLSELIGWLDLRSRVYLPITVVGFGLGAEAAILATAEDDRINRVMAINPYLTTERMQALQKEQHDLLWIPFYNTIMWWWYNTSSGYAAPYREIDQIRPVKASTMLMLPTDQTEIPEVKRLAELSGDKLTVIALPENMEAAIEAVTDYLIPRSTETDGN